LAPGAVANFTGSYPAPTNCSVADTLFAGAESKCGVFVTSTVSATCPITTTPQIAVTAACPAAPVLPGGSLTYSGTVQNTGNITLTNVIVVSSRPAPNTTVFTAATLAPGASANFTGTYAVPTNACSVATTFSGTGQDLCAAITVTNTVSTTCTVTTAPAIAVTLACPAVPAAAGALITYTGTVRNSGNVTLDNVTVVNNQAVPSTVLTVPSLAPGASANFAASFTAPTNTCSVSSTVTATGSDNCTSILVTNTASATCPLVTTPSIVVTQVCPVGPTIPGGLLTYSGTVGNAGNITLTNVVVVNNLSGTTPVFTTAMLAPGAVANFTGSYVAPTNCSSTSTSTATGQSICGVAVTNTVSATCPILAAPQIAVTAVCPATPVSPGGLLTYSGTVRNTGNFTLTNVIVVSSRPAPNTTVFTAATLAAGASANFSGAYTVPASACSVATTFSGTGQDSCAGSLVTNTVSTTCTVTTAPAIAVTLACPAVSASAGGPITYSGTVRNTGDVTLNNVFVVNNQPAPNTPVIGPLTLAPGASNIFTVSFTAPTNACSVSSTVIATGNDNCTAATVTSTASATCPLITTPSLMVTQVCPVSPAIPGGLLTYSGMVTNTGNITLTNVVVLNNLSGTTPILTVATLAPGAGTNFTGSYVAPTNCSVTSISTATGWSACGAAVTNTISSTCPILTAPAIAVTQACPSTPPVQGGILTYSGTVSNASNVTLTNIVVVNNWPVANTVVFTAASLAPHATTNFTGSYVVPANCCVAWLTLEARGQGCGGATVTDTDTGTCTVFTSPGIVVTKVCAPGVLRPGDLLTYSGIVSNTGNITLINVTVVNNQPGAGSSLLGPIDLAPGQSAPYAASYIVPDDFCGNDTVTASGLDVCGNAPVANSVTTTCPVTTTPLIAVTKLCPPQPTPHGGQLIFSGMVTNLGNVTLVNVTVVNDQPSNNTPVIGPVTLAPGAFLNFTGSYTAPLVCCEIIDTLTARGQDRCSGSNVTAEATAVCPTLYTPGIALVQNCPPNPLPMGSLYSLSGFVTNTGDAILTNVVVFSSQAGQNLALLGPLDLAPGQSEPYSGSLILASNISGVTVTATSQETCKGIRITNAITCPILSTPSITITESCPPGPVSAGSSVVFGGLVSNSGSITLTNILVFSGQPTNNTPVLGPITLAPGASVPFTGSYVATGGSNPTTNSTVVTNSSGTITTNVASVITTNSTVTVTTNAVTATFGTIDPDTGKLTDRFNIPNNSHGLTYADQDENWGPTLFYAIQQPASGPDMFDTISTVPPLAGFVTNRFDLTSTNYDALTFAAPDVGYGEVNFYYIRHDNSGVSTFGEIIAQGASSSKDLWPLARTGYNALAFAAANLGYGANMFYYLRQNNAGLSFFGTINPTPGGIATDRYTVGTNFDSLVFVPGGLFAYLRHDNTGSILGSFDPVTHAVTDLIDLGTNFLSALTFTVTDVGYGPNLFYYLRPGGSTITTNVVTTFTTNTLITFTTNAVTTYTTNSVVSFTPTNTVTATGMDARQGNTVAATANCPDPVGQVLPAPVIITMANGLLGLSFPSENGKSYTVQYKTALSDPTWTDLETVVGTGGNLPVTDGVAAQQPTRFYRVISTP
jgi:uncharacterized repeat protein (TIGR01451 family)